MIYAYKMQNIASSKTLKEATMSELPFFFDYWHHRMRSLIRQGVRILNFEEKKQN